MTQGQEDVLQAYGRRDRPAVQQRRGVADEGSRMTTEEQREGWRTVAAGWERQRAALWATTRPVSERLVELLAPEPGNHARKLAGGSGDTGLLATERVGPTGRLIESDFVPPIVDSARRRAVELGAGNVEFRVLDSEALDLPDGSIDGVLCRWGFVSHPTRRPHSARRHASSDREDGSHSQCGGPRTRTLGPRPSDGFSWRTAWSPHRSPTRPRPVSPRRPQSRESTRGGR